MSLYLIGRVTNMFDVPERHDKKSGEVFPAHTKVQLMTETVLGNGQKQLDIKDLRASEPEMFKRQQGNLVRVPVDVWAISANSYGVFQVKGSLVEPVDEKTHAPLKAS